MSEPLSADRAANLRDLWPTLHPRERDALVAKAKGWHVQWHHAGDGEIIIDACPPDSNKMTRLTIWARYHPDKPPATMREGELLPCFDNWPAAGALLEEMLAAGLYVEMGRLGEASAVCVLEVETRFESIEAETYPSGICLAYVLWKAGAA